MPNDLRNNKTISKTNSGFPAYLDFDKLRSEGIAYLGKLSGKLWTDHNVHDPGITILEELCYALLDLGYRTNLPVEDLLAQDSTDSSIDNNFLTPGEILSCNPLTINDYRKLLIDIPGVRNGWLQPATDIGDRCKKQVETNESNPANRDGNKQDQTACTEFLNGLYHVYIETDEELVTDTTAWKALLANVKQTLLSHRNLCEDFADIYILCRVEMGVCASIELEEAADIETVYIAIGNRLREFFSPAPTFYSLPQLLEKGKAMEDIFAGRPYSSESHGFVDTDELEKIKLKKEIHTSDVYNAIFEVEGVKRISKLRIRNCGKECNPPANEKKSAWKLHIPENHIPSFSIGCSGFEFTKNGMPVEIDTQKFETLFELSFTHTGKVKYKISSPYLNNQVPKGIYHQGLGDYYSIQNDFPRVYGIAEGGLQDDASPKRKAWALQLKGYLLFFDQLLANYLSQLKNIRQLFQPAGALGKKDQHTYFLNTLNTVPEMSKLLRFGTGGADNPIGATGSILVYPVIKEEWEKINTSQLLAEDIFNSQKQFSFSNSNSMQDAARDRKSVV